MGAAREELTAHAAARGHQQVAIVGRPIRPFCEVVDQLATARSMQITKVECAQLSAGDAS